MRRRDEIGHQVIVKRRSKRGHEQAKNGAWKVAFADFTLAMMALFMVLWIVQPQTDAKRLQSMGDTSSSLIDGGAGVFDGTHHIPLELVVTESVAPVESVVAPTATDKPQVEEPERYDTESELKMLANLMSLLAEQADAVANVEIGRAHV